MPKLYGNKPQQVFAEGDDIEDIIPLDDIDPPECGVGDGETATTTHEGGVEEEKAGSIYTASIDDKGIIEGISGEITTVTAESAIPEEKAGAIRSELADADQVAEEVEGTIEKITAHNKPTLEKAGVTEIDVVDDLRPEEKEGTISTTVDPGDVCINE